jgi:hypothetical protein
MRRERCEATEEKANGRNGGASSSDLLGDLEGDGEIWYGGARGKERRGLKTRDCAKVTRSAARSGFFTFGGIQHNFYHCGIYRSYGLPAVNPTPTYCFAKYIGVALSTSN